MAWWQTSWRQMKKNFSGKHRTAARKQKANNAVLNFFARRFVGFSETDGFIVFCHPYKTPNVSKKKEENERAGVTGSHLWRPRSAFYLVWRKRCSHARDPDLTNQMPGERVGNFIEITHKSPVAQRAGGFHNKCFVSFWRRATSQIDRIFIAATCTPPPGFSQ